MDDVVTAQFDTSTFYWQVVVFAFFDSYYDQFFPHTSCSVPCEEGDNDLDHVCNENDACPDDRHKIEPGICGCDLLDDPDDIEFTRLGPYMVNQGQQIEVALDSHVGDNAINIRLVSQYVEHYNKTRTQLNPNKDRPIPREVDPTEHGAVKSKPVLGGLHHAYFRQAA